jgi:hypothetical protein
MSEMRTAYKIFVGKLEGKKRDYLVVMGVDGRIVRDCIQKFPNWPPGARTANGTAICH